MCAQAATVCMTYLWYHQIYALVLSLILEDAFSPFRRS